MYGDVTAALSMCLWRYVSAKEGMVLPEHNLLSLATASKRNGKTRNGARGYVREVSGLSLMLK